MNEYKTELKYKSMKKPFLTLDNFLFYEHNATKKSFKYRALQNWGNTANYC